MTLLLVGLLLIVLGVALDAFQFTRKIKKAVKIRATDRYARIKMYIKGEEE